MENFFADLVQRLFVHSKSSLEGLALVVLRWLSTNGIEISPERKGQFIAGLGALALAAWKFLSRDKEVAK